VKAQPERERHTVMDSAAVTSVNPAQVKVGPVWPDSDLEPDSDQEPESDGGAEDARPTSDRAQRSEYVGRGNVQAVRVARRMAGLSESFPRGDPLLVEFAEFLRVAGAAANDISNKVS